MRITYDPNVKAMYIYIHDGEVARSKMLNDSTVIDYDEDGQVRGIELLQIEEPRIISYELLSKRLPETE